MTGKKTGGKKKRGKFNLVNAALVAFVCFALLVGAGIGWFLYQQHATLQAKEQAREQTIQQAEEKRQAALRANPPPATLVNDSVAETIKYASQHGWVPCPGDCLKLAMRGWHHRHVDGFPPSYVWMEYRYSDGSHLYSQHHIGHIIRTYVDRPAEDVGICPVCGGTGWVKKGSQN
ncbi:MAG TPA: hypothetical protein V6D22_08485 [Candidatus Obscuribacterales bacterium]